MSMGTKKNEKKKERNRFAMFTKHLFESTTGLKGLLNLDCLMKIGGKKAK